MMEDYSDINNISDSIMIKQLQKRLKKEREEAERCVFCGSNEKLYKYRGIHYCRECYEELLEL